MRMEMTDKQESHTIFIPKKTDFKMKTIKKTKKDTNDKRINSRRGYYTCQ